jgi:hypothetical protein
MHWCCSGMILLVDRTPALASSQHVCVPLASLSGLASLSYCCGTVSDITPLQVLPRRTKEATAAHSYREIASYSPAMKELKIVIEKPSVRKNLPGQTLRFETRHGARFSAAIYTRGCHWIPHPFA